MMRGGGGGGGWRDFVKVPPKILKKRLNIKSKNVVALPRRSIPERDILKGSFK